MQGFGELIEAADLNALLRAVDGLCEARSWDELLELADRCEDALERGKQLWPIAQHIDYRMALEAPADYAVQVLTEESGRFSHGPLTEVVASTHSWDDLAPHIDRPQIAAYVAQERVLRGEILDGDARTHSDVLQLPLHVEGWEPTYCTAVFKSDHVEVPEPWEPRRPLRAVGAEPAAVVDDAELEGALLDLVTPWTTESNGAARAVVVTGDAASAAATLTHSSLSMTEVTVAEAFQRMAWAAASGGAHGRRRGGAFGRFAAWSVASLIAGVPWPAAPDDLAGEVESLWWFLWDEGLSEKGWILRLAVEDPDGQWACALGATDLLETDVDDDSI